MKFSTHTARLFLAPFLLTLLVVLAGCAKQGGDSAGSGTSSTGSSAREKCKSGEKVIVGFSQMENNGPWRIAETASIKSEAAKRSDKFELKDTDARAQTSQQVSDVEDLIAQGVDVLFLAPKEYEGLAPALQAAREANIPVFLIDREAAGTVGQDYVSFLGSNFIEQGKRAGEWLAQTTNGKANIVELTGTAGASVARDRAQGFRDAISKYPDMKIIASQTGEFTRSEGLRVMQNIIQSKGNEITAVYTHNDEMALGAIEALKAAGRKPGVDVIVISVDGQRTALEAIARGELNATVESNPRFGPLAFDTLEKYLKGETIPNKIILEDRFFDKSNAGQFASEAY
ncbi:MAG: ABC transporter substrate-binding protein [Pyrinomonadaceae bacterium MAG19_C2-C3]|nr:ABC transporter substrate-binding protein [Pyrinomonadaceae bacterium MAG19_C2-C3]